MFTLFEYGHSIQIHDRKGFEAYLCSLWQDHKHLWTIAGPATPVNPYYQPFLSFDGNEARANNFIGYINYEGNEIEIYPKIFQKEPVPGKHIMHRHLFFWLSYCKRIKFPVSRSFLENFDVTSFPELIIYLMAKEIFETISSNPYFAYEPVEEALLTPRGRINFNRYTTSMSQAKHHLIDCDHEPFIYDNKVNGIIKYCTRLLLSRTKIAETQRVLNEIIFLLDEVDDQVYDVRQLDKLKISGLFQDYEQLIHFCRMILENQVYSHSAYEMKKWTLLLPMEVIFEEFIAGFLQTHFGQEYKIEVQKSDLYLHQDPPVFNIQHDILVTNKTTKEQVIIDTKYKPRWNPGSADDKRGVSQDDLYQAISYAYRRGVNKVILMYPNTSETLAEDFVFRVQKGKEKEEIKIRAIDVPFWSAQGENVVSANLLNRLRDVLRYNF